MNNKTAAQYEFQFDAWFIQLWRKPWTIFMEKLSQVCEKLCIIKFSIVLEEGKH